MFRQRVQFDPMLIILEIISFQLIFYGFFMLFSLIFDFLSGVSFSTEQIFNYAVFGAKSQMGRSCMIGSLAGGMSVAVAFALVEGRSRKALDFIGTTYIIHIIVATVTSHFPKSMIWWLTHFVGWSISTILAEFLSMKNELQEINLDTAFNRAERQL